MLPNDRSKITAQMIKPMDYKKCACGRTIAPAMTTCDECQKTKHYFGESDSSQPHDLGMPYKRNNG